MKLMKIQTIRLSDELYEAIGAFAAKYGVSRQDAMRLAIRKGLERLEEYFAEAKKEEEARGDDRGRC